jgi:hypothetical protein
VGAYAGEEGMGVAESFQPDGKLDVAGAHNILDFELLEIGLVVKLLQNFAILPKLRRDHT